MVTTFRSSIGQDFLVVADQPFVQGVNVPNKEELRVIVAQANSLIDQWESNEAAILTDFEGTSQSLL